MQLRRVVAGTATDNAELRRELLRLKQANRTLELELKTALHPQLASSSSDNGA